MQKIPLTVIHYGRHDPRTKTGGVETFARDLGLAFRDVRFLQSKVDGPGSPAMAQAIAEGLPVVCDNHLVMDWPEHYPVIGFQHGVAAEKKDVSRSWTDRGLANQQARAAKRKATLWVAGAQWISGEFEKRHGNIAAHIVYHAVDIDRFDGQPDNQGSRLVVHDGRSMHKGAALYPVLKKALPGWSFEPLSCAPADVPDRMRRACAFLHLSRYEGNSIVCNEAMAMNLPCLFTRVGLMRDGEDLDVEVVEVNDVFGCRRRLVDVVSAFLQGLGERSYQPRRWTMQHATPEASIDSWRRVIADWQKMRRA
jgi:glycosyltransferase involved in cell wall biosynthesis